LFVPVASATNRIQRVPADFLAYADTAAAFGSESLAGERRRRELSTFFIEKNTTLVVFPIRL